MFNMPGHTEWIVILLIVLVLFGAKRLPGLGASLGQSLRNFKKSISGEDEKKPEESKKIDPSNPT